MFIARFYVAKKTTDLTEAQRIARIGSWEFDVASGVSTWSDQQFLILGFDPNVPLPKYANFFDIVPLVDQPNIRAAVEEAIAHGTPYMVEHGIIRPDRSICHVISRGEAICDDQGKVVRLIGTITDISDRKRLEIELTHSRDLRELIFNESTDAMFLVDSKTSLIIDCNQQAIKLFEVEDKNDLLNIEGRTLHKRQFTRQELAQIDQEVNQNGFCSIEVEYLTRKGREFWGDLSLKRITFGEQQY
ncbi:MAG: PAS domain-containing protein, partial [Pseudanabaena sp.]